MKLENVVVFCGSSMGFGEKYQTAAKALGHYFAENGISLVYGGGKVGLMGVTADAVLEKNGTAIGVIPGLLKEEEVMHNALTEMVVTETMSERKVVMSKMIDAYVTMPGGFGTLDELFEALTLQQLHIEQKPVGLLNVEGFFDPVLEQLDRMVKEGFLKPENRALLLVAATVPELMDQLRNYTAPKVEAIINKVVKKNDDKL
ncbi:LOG family protein YvdD [Tenacibaculum litopenaei]|uniref:LOG family protein n=1 Tax=Tenacibaculum litopenaei TaxID=396016 RepID=UPI003895DEED